MLQLSQTDDICQSCFAQSIEILLMLDLAMCSSLPAYHGVKELEEHGELANHVEEENKHGQCPEAGEGDKVIVHFCGSE